MPALSDSVFNTLNFLTSYKNPELTKEAAKYDIFDYLVKSSSVKDTLKIIQNALRESHISPRRRTY